MAPGTGQDWPITLFGYAIQMTSVPLLVAEMVPANRRGSAYGVFTTAYGVSWFLGSALMGILYDRSLAMLIAFSLLAELVAIPSSWRFGARCAPEACPGRG